jgi:hypothetical protein
MVAGVMDSTALTAFVADNIRDNPDLHILMVIVGDDRSQAGYESDEWRHIQEAVDFCLFCKQTRKA